MVDLLLQSSLIVRIALGATPEAKLLAEVVPPFAADATLTTGYTYFKSNPIADFEASYLRSDADNFTGRLMPQRQGMAGAEVAVGKLLEV